MKLIPKKNKIALPVVGVVNKEDFTAAHLNLLKGWCESKDIPLEGIIRKHFDIVHEGGQVVMPQFDDVLKNKIQRKRRKK